MFGYESFRCVTNMTCRTCAIKGLSHNPEIIIATRLAQKMSKNLVRAAINQERPLMAPVQ